MRNPHQSTAPAAAAPAPALAAAAAPAAAAAAPADARIELPYWFPEDKYNHQLTEVEINNLLVYLLLQYPGKHANQMSFPDEVVSVVASAVPEDEAEVLAEVIADGTKDDRFIQVPLYTENPVRGDSHLNRRDTHKVEEWVRNFEQKEKEKVTGRPGLGALRYYYGVMNVQQNHWMPYLIIHDINSGDPYIYTMQPSYGEKKETTDLHGAFMAEFGPAAKAIDVGVAQQINGRNCGVMTMRMLETIIRTYGTDRSVLDGYEFKRDCLDHSLVVDVSENSATCAPSEVEKVKNVVGRCVGILDKFGDHQFYVSDTDGSTSVVAIKKEGADFSGRTEDQRHEDLSGQIQSQEEVYGYSLGQILLKFEEKTFAVNTQREFILIASRKLRGELSDIEAEAELVKWLKKVVQNGHDDASTNGSTSVILERLYAEVIKPKYDIFEAGVIKSFSGLIEGSIEEISLPDMSKFVGLAREQLSGNLTNNQVDLELREWFICFVESGHNNINRNVLLEAILNDLYVKVVVPKYKEALEIVRQHESDSDSDSYSDADAVLDVALDSGDEGRGAAELPAEPPAPSAVQAPVAEDGAGSDEDIDTVSVAVQSEDLENINHRIAQAIKSLEGYPKLNQYDGKNGNPRYMSLFSRAMSSSGCNNPGKVNVAITELKSLKSEEMSDDKTQGFLEILDGLCKLNEFENKGASVLVKDILTDFLGIEQTDYIEYLSRRQRGPGSTKDYVKMLEEKIKERIALLNGDPLVCN